MDLAERPPEPFPPEPPLPEPPPVPPPAPEPPPQPGPRARENANRPTVYSDRVRGVRSTDRGDREIPHSPLAVNAQEVVAVRDPRRHADRGEGGLPRDCHLVRGRMDRRAQRRRVARDTREAAALTDAVVEELSYGP